MRADADLGDLLHEPLEAIALRRRDGDGDVGAAAARAATSPSGSSAPPPRRHVRHRPAPSVTVTAAPSRRRSTRPRWWAAASSSDGRVDVGDEHVGGRATQRLVHGTAYENADLMRENRPFSGGFTALAALLGQLAQQRRSSSSSFVGTSTTSWARRSPRPRPCSSGHAAVAQHELPARLGAGRHDELLVAVERRQGDGRAERGLGDRDRHGRHEVVAVAPVAVVLGDAQVDVQVAGAAATRAGRARGPAAAASSRCRRRPARRPGTCGRR